VDIPLFWDEDGGAVTAVIIDSCAIPITYSMAADFTKVTFTPTIA
jgi:hypothetical protein